MFKSDIYRSCGGKTSIRENVGLTFNNNNSFLATG